MNAIEMQGKFAVATPRASMFDMKLEVVAISVSDIDRAKGFYSALGWRLDLDFRGMDHYRVIQFTPPGSGCSVIFGENVTAVAPGSAQGLYLIVSDLKAVRNELICRGIEVSEPFHDARSVFPHADAKSRVGGLHPQRESYASYASFSDPDGNGWLLQEVAARLPGDIEADDTRFNSRVFDVILGASIA